MNIRFNKKQQHLYNGNGYDFMDPYEFLIWEKRSLLNKESEYLEEVHSPRRKSLSDLINKINNSKKVDW